MAFVFFDIDGTLWDEKMNIPESTKKAIQKLQENGHKAFICTGRSMANVNDPQFAEIGFDGYIASCGNHIEMDGKVLYERILPYEEVKKIYDVSRECKMPIIFEGAKFQWLDREGFEEDNFIRHIVENLRETAIYLDECKLEDIYVNKFSAYVHEDTDYETIKRELDTFDILEHGGGVVEAVPVGTSKATGIAWICEHLGIQNEDVYAIGDSINDLEMLEYAGHGIAMGNASDVAKEKAEYITTYIHDDGIWNALKHYGLI